MSPIRLLKIEMKIKRSEVANYIVKVFTKTSYVEMNQGELIGLLLVRDLKLSST